MHTRATIALLAALLAASTAACTSNNTTGKSAASSAPAATITPNIEEKPTEEATDTGDSSYALTDTMGYENGVKVSLSGFMRKTSSEYASPENTPYLKFTAKVVNGSGTMLDMSSLMVSCLYGEDGKQGEQIFDDGLETPTTHLRPGRSINVTTGCQLPKDEHYVQIEIAPDFESETAIFAGEVK